MLTTLTLFLVLLISTPVDGANSIVTSELLVISTEPKNTLTSVLASVYDPAKAFPELSVLITTESLLKSTNKGEVPFKPSDTTTIV